jgi:cellulose synthase/poly-beta-1,6-N-acetylglucosamine synthase-like glycosyltransferase
MMKVTEATKERATQRTAEPAAALLVLTWNNYSDTAECIETLLRLDYSNYKIIGIDNHSTDGSIERLKREFSQVTFIENEENFGFDVAMNRGPRWTIWAGGSTRATDTPPRLNRTRRRAPRRFSEATSFLAARC